MTEVLIKSGGRLFTLFFSAFLHQENGDDDGDDDEEDDDDRDRDGCRVSARAHCLKG